MKHYKSVKFLSIRILFCQGKPRKRVMRARVLCTSLCRIRGLGLGHSGWARFRAEV